jgi:RNA polymerase sigma factor (sigma-70 family)
VIIVTPIGSPGSLDLRYFSAMHSTPTPDDLSAALESVLAKFSGMVRSVGWRHRLSDEDVDEVIQQVRIRLWHAHGDSEQIRRAPASYIYRTAVTAALDLIRRRRAQRQDMMVPIEDEEGKVPSTPTPERSLESSELAEQVARAIDTLPDSRRPVVRMYLAGYPREEISSLLGWSEAKTRNLLYRGLADLRGTLTAQGIGWEVER